MACACTENQKKIEHIEILNHILSGIKYPAVKQFIEKTGNSVISFNNILYNIYKKIKKLLLILLLIILGPIIVGLIIGVGTIYMMYIIIKNFIKNGDKNDIKIDAPWYTFKKIKEKFKRVKNKNG
jgi:hypothetical protein